MNTKDSPGSGSAVSGSVLRENVNRNSAHPSRATRAASRTACRNSPPVRARFQIPCATIKSKPADANGNRSIDARNRRTRFASAASATRAAAAVNIGNERSVPTTSQPAWANGNAFRPAPHPMSSNRADARHSRAATCCKVSFGDDRTKPATVLGWLQRESLMGRRLPARSSVTSWPSPVSSVVQRARRTAVCCWLLEPGRRVKFRHTRA